MTPRPAAALTAVAALLALTACHGVINGSHDPAVLDDAGRRACDDFSVGYNATQTGVARTGLVGKVSRFARRSRTDRIADAASGLARGAEGSPTDWQIAAAGFAKACLDAGWTA